MSKLGEFDRSPLGAFTRSPLGARNRTSGVFTPCCPNVPETLYGRFFGINGSSDPVLGDDAALSLTLVFDPASLRWNTVRHLSDGSSYFFEVWCQFTPDGYLWNSGWSGLNQLFSWNVFTWKCNPLRVTIYGTISLSNSWGTIPWLLYISDRLPTVSPGGIVSNLCPESFPTTLHGRFGGGPGVGCPDHGEWSFGYNSGGDWGALQLIGGETIGFTLKPYKDHWTFLWSNLTTGQSKTYTITNWSCAPLTITITDAVPIFTGQCVMPWTFTITTT